jgi:DNA polymerase
MDARGAALWHLRRAAERYGADLPLRAALAAFAARAARAAAPAAADPAPPAPPAARARSTAPVPPHAAAPAIRAPAPAPAPASASAPPAPLAASLDELRAQALVCTRCKLAGTRTQVVFGEGNPHAELMFVGEAPGQREDEQGRPFVGPAGQLLTKIIENAVGLRRADVYIANVNKCRPPGNRNPEPDEVAACLPILREQIRLIRPKLIVALGRVAAANLLASQESVARLRGRTFDHDGVPVVVTWHPAYLLRNPAAKRETWEDVKRINRMLGRPEVPARPAG